VMSSASDAQEMVSGHVFACLAPGLLSLVISRTAFRSGIAVSQGSPLLYAIG